MANLSQTQKDALRKIGITGTKTVEDACEKMISELTAKGVTGLDDEPFENLVMYCEAFEISDSQNEEEQNDALAREVEEEDNTRRIADEEDDDEEELPAPKKTAKQVAKPAPAAKQVAKPSVPTKATAPAKIGVDTKFDARNIPAHKEFLAFLNDFFPPAEVQYDLLKQGVTLRALMSNSRPTVLNFDEVRIHANGTVSGNVYFNKFKSVEDLLEFLPDGFEESHKMGMFRGETHPSVKALTQEEIIQIFTETEVVAETFRRVGKLDAKMSANREKMKEGLLSSEQKSAKQAPVVASKASKPSPAAKTNIPAAKAVKKK